MCKGKEITPYINQPTPHPATVDAVCEVISTMIKQVKSHFDRVSAGFPGVVAAGIIKTAPNMNASWIDVNFQESLEKITKTPTRIANDADVQGFGDETGKGVELTITLGTGVGSALFLNGQLVPNLELGHHPFVNSKSYENLLSKAALDKDGAKKWQANLQQAIALWLQTFNCDKLCIGGGLSALIDWKLPEKVYISNNIEGTLGGIKLWQH